MKRLVMTALAVVLAAQAPAAFAQGRGGGGDRAERAEGRHEGRGGGHGRPDGAGVRPQREWSEGRRGGGERRGGNEAPRAREAPQAAQAPQAPRAAEPRVRADSYRGTAGQDGGRRWEGRRADGVRGDSVRDGRRWDGDAGRQVGERRDWRRDDGRREGDRRWDGRRYDDRREYGHRDDDRRYWDRDRGDRWDGRRDYRRWERGRYPSVYFSSHRYRYPWRAPSGFYLRVWSFGDFYPRSWYGPGYWIDDPWLYDLPLPPPGYEWVRSGPDALLIDEYTGRIVQVVRNIFWY